MVITWYAEDNQSKDRSTKTLTPRHGSPDAFLYVLSNNREYILKNVFHGSITIKIEKFLKSVAQWRTVAKPLLLTKHTEFYVDTPLSFIKHIGDFL